MNYKAIGCVTFAVLLVVSLSACSKDDAESGAEASSEISAIESIASENRSSDVAFKELKSLVDYSREPADKRPYAAKQNLNFTADLYLLREEISLKGCTLLSEKHWRAASTTHAVDLNTPANEQTIVSYAWKMNLDEVDAEKTDALRESKIILVRGAVFDYQMVQQKGWQKSEALQAIRDFGRYDWIINPGKNVKSEQNRSGEFKLGLAYPEDQKEIQDAFDLLVKSCKSYAPPKIDEKIIGKWEDPVNAAYYIEFYHDYTYFLDQRGYADNANGTWAVENNVITTVLPWKDMIINREYAFDGSDLVLLSREGSKTNTRLVRVEATSDSMDTRSKPTESNANTTPATHQRNIPNVDSTELIEHKDLTLTMDELMAKGEAAYNTNCAACHQPSGAGIPGVFPAIAGSAIATGDVAAHIDIVVNGKVGTAMQAFGRQLNAVDLAAIITYERNAFGNNAGDIVQSADVVAAK